MGRGLQSEDATVVFARSCGSVCNKQPTRNPQPSINHPYTPSTNPSQEARHQADLRTLGTVQSPASGLRRHTLRAAVIRTSNHTDGDFSLAFSSNMKHSVSAAGALSGRASEHRQIKQSVSPRVAPSSGVLRRPRRNSTSIAAPLAWHVLRLLRSRWRPPRRACCRASWLATTLLSTIGSAMTSTSVSELQL